MNDLEKHLENARPNLEVPIFQRNLRHDLLRATYQEAPSRLGYVWSFCAGVALAVLALTALTALRPQTSMELVAGIGGILPQPYAEEPTEMTAGLSDEAELYNALFDDRFREADKGFLAAQQEPILGEDALQLEPVGAEEVLTVRQYRTQAGKLVRVYTSHSREDKQRPVRGTPVVY